jgi:hypothetical protein
MGESETPMMREPMAVRVTTTWGGWDESQRIPFDPADYVDADGLPLRVGTEAAYVGAELLDGEFDPTNVEVVKLHPRDHIADGACICVRDRSGRKVCVNVTDLRTIVETS